MKCSVLFVTFMAGTVLSDANNAISRDKKQYFCQQLCVPCDGNSVYLEGVCYCEVTQDEAVERCVAESRMKSRSVGVEFKVVENNSRLVRRAKPIRGSFLDPMVANVFEDVGRHVPRSPRAVLQPYLEILSPKVTTNNQIRRSVPNLSDTFANNFDDTLHKVVPRDTRRKRSLESKGIPMVLLIDDGAGEGERPERSASSPYATVILTEVEEIEPYEELYAEMPVVYHPQTVVHVPEPMFVYPDSGLVQIESQHPELEMDLWNSNQYQGGFGQYQAYGYPDYTDRVIRCAGRERSSNPKSEGEEGGGDQDAVKSPGLLQAFHKYRNKMESPRLSMEDIAAIARHPSMLSDKIAKVMSAFKKLYRSKSQDNEVPVQVKIIDEGDTNTNTNNEIDDGPVLEQ